MQRLLAPREAANILGISYPTLKQWIYRGKLKTAKTPGGHHRVPESEIDRLIPAKLNRGDIASIDRKSTRLNSSHSGESRMPSSA